MSKPIRSISRSRKRSNDGKNRFEHWLVDNQVYFITARCRDKYPAFKSEEAKAIFWDRFEHYIKLFGFDAWIVTLMDNHYHAEGYFSDASGLPLMMQRLHGSVAKLVNDLLPERREKFWRDAKGHEYFDGCLRDPKQGRLTYGYILRQAERHGVARDYRQYAHTHIYVPMEDAIRFAEEKRAFLLGVPYKRYLKRERPAR